VLEVVRRDPGGNERRRLEELPSLRLDHFVREPLDLPSRRIHRERIGRREATKKAPRGAFPGINGSDPYIFLGAVLVDVVVAVEVVVVEGAAMVPVVSVVVMVVPVVPVSVVVVVVEVAVVPVS
jgi:hypothetical protein